MTRRNTIARMRALSTKPEHRYWTMRVDGSPWLVLTDGVGFIAIQASDPAAGAPTPAAKRWISTALKLAGNGSKRVARNTIDRWLLQCPRKLDSGYLIGMVDAHAFDRKAVRRWLDLMPGATFDVWLRKHSLGPALMVRAPGALIGVMSMLSEAKGPVLHLRSKP